MRQRNQKATKSSDASESHKVKTTIASVCGFQLKSRVFFCDEERRRMGPRCWWRCAPPFPSTFATKNDCARPSSETRAAACTLPSLFCLCLPYHCQQTNKRRLMSVRRGESYQHERIHRSDGRKQRALSAAGLQTSTVGGVRIQLTFEVLTDFDWKVKKDFNRPRQ